MQKKYFGTIKSGSVSGSRVTLSVESDGANGIVMLSNVGSALDYIRPDVTLNITTDADGNYSMLLFSGIRFDVVGVLAGCEQIVEILEPSVLDVEPELLAA